MAEVEITVEACLKELVEIFADRYVELQMFASRDGIAWAVKAGTGRDPLRFTDDTLADCMAQVRRWKQTNEH